MHPANGPLKREFIFLGAVLALEAAAAATPWFSGGASRLFPSESTAMTESVHFLTGVVLPGAVSFLVLVGSRSRAGSSLYLVQFAVSCVIVLGTQLRWMMLAATTVGRGGCLVLVSYLGWLFQVFSVPALWGTARALSEQPGSSHLRQTLRQAAGVVQLGFVFSFIGLIPELASLGSQARSPAWTTTLVVLAQLVELAGRLLLLWSSIQGVRTASNDDITLLRARRIHLSMIAWIASVGLMGFVRWVDQCILSPAAPGGTSGRLELLQFALMLTCTLVAAAAWARRLLAPARSPATAPLPRSGTGNPGT